MGSLYEGTKSYTPAEHVDLTHNGEQLDAMFDWRKLQKVTVVTFAL